MSGGGVKVQPVIGINNYYTSTPQRARAHSLSRRLPRPPLQKQRKNLEELAKKTEIVRPTLRAPSSYIPPRRVVRSATPVMDKAFRTVRTDRKAKEASGREPSRARPSAGRRPIARPPIERPEGARAV